MSAAQYGVKLALTALIVVAVSELARRSTFWGALLASLPLTSVLAFVWLHVETGDDARVASLATGILWMVIPSLVLFVTLPLLLRAGWGFWPGLMMACVATALAYFGMQAVLAAFGIRI